MKPILFNTDMVRAVLDGRKICTRRHPFQMPDDYNTLKGMYRGDHDRLCALFQFENDPTTEAVYARYTPGDILYVRETWCDPSGTGYPILFLSGTKRKNPFCYCTNCAYPVPPKRVSNYCPNCGAKMDLGG